MLKQGCDIIEIVLKEYLLGNAKGCIGEGKSKVGGYSNNINKKRWDVNYGSGSRNSRVKIHLRGILDESSCPSGYSPMREEFELTAFRFLLCCCLFVFFVWLVFTITYISYSLKLKFWCRGTIL